MSPLCRCEEKDSLNKLRNENIMKELTPKRYADFSRKIRKFETWRGEITTDILENLPQEAARILDIGTGPGLLIKQLFKRIKNRPKLIGSDIDVEMIEEMKKTRRECSDALCFLVHNNQQLPFKDEVFNLVVSVNAMHHFKYPSEMIGEMMRLTKKGGRVIIYDFDPENLKLRITCLMLSLLKGVIRHAGIKALIQSVRQSYTKKEMRMFAAQAGAKNFRTYSLKSSNALLINK